MAKNDDVKIKVETVVEGQKELVGLQREIIKTGDISEGLGGSLENLAESFGNLAEANKLRENLEQTGEAAELAALNYQNAADSLEEFKRTTEEAAGVMTPESITAVNKEIQKQERELKALEMAQNKANKAQERAQRAASNAGAEVRELVEDSTAYNNKIREITASQALLNRELENIKDLNAAYDVAGVKNLEEEIQKLEKAYITLKNSGKLSTNELKQAQENLNKAIKENKSALDGTSDAYKNLKTAGLQFAPMAAGLALVGKAAIDYEDKLADVKKVVTATDEEFAALSQTLLNMSKVTPVSAAGLAEIAAAGAQLGVTVDNLESFTQIAANMSVAFDVTAEVAGKSIASLSNIFGIAINDTERLGDAINHISNNSAAAAPQLVDVLTRIGAQGRAVGLAADEVAALGSTLVAFGKSPEVAGTAINNFLAKLQTLNSAGAKTQDALNKMGVSASDMAVRLREDASEAIVYFLEKVNELDTTDKATALTSIFGIGQQSDVLQMASNLDVLKNQFNLVGDAAQYAGSMQEEAASRSDTTASQIILMKNNIDALAITMGSQLLPVINQGIDVVNTFATALANFGEANPELAKLIVYLGAAVPAMKALNAVTVLIGGTAKKTWGIMTAGLLGTTQGLAAATAASARLNLALKGIQTIASRVLLPLMAISTVIDLFNEFTENMRAHNAVVEATARANEIYAESQKKLHQANQELKESTASLALEQLKGREATQSQIDEINRLTEDLSTLGLTYDSVMLGMSKEADKAIKAFAAIGNNAQSNGKIISQSFAAALNDIKGPEEFQKITLEFNTMAEAGKLTGVNLTEATAKLEEMRLSMALGNLTQEEFNTRKTELIKLLNEESNGFNAVNLEISKQVELINEQMKLDKQLMQSSIKKLQAEREYALAIGDSVRAAELQRQIQLVNIAGMKDEAEAVKALIIEYQKEAALLNARAANGEILNDDDNKRLRALNNEIASRQNEVEAIERSAQAKELDAQQSAVNSASLDRLAKSNDNVARSANNAVNAQKGVAKASGEAEESTRKFAERAGSSQSWLGGLADESKKSEEALNALKGAVNDLNKATAIDAFGGGLFNFNAATGKLNALKADIAAQIIKAEELESQMSNLSRGGIGSIEAMQKTINSLNYVGDDTIKNLNGKLDEMRQAALDVYADIDRENARMTENLTGMRNKDEAHQMRMRQNNEIAEAQRKIREAEEQGDGEKVRRLEQQKRIIQATHQQEQRLAKEEQRQKNKDSKQTIDVNINGEKIENFDAEAPGAVDEIAAAVVVAINKDKKKSTQFRIRG